MKPRGYYTRPDYSIDGKPFPVIYALSEALVPRPASYAPNIIFSGFWTDESIIHFNLDPGLEEFVNAGEAPVYIGFGSMGSGNMEGLMDKVVKGVEKAGVRAVINTGWAGAERLRRVSPNCYAANNVPHSWLLPRVSAMVHHGGAGTTASGLRAGKPTLIIPFGGDQPFWGNRVYECGCGPKPIPRGLLTSEKLAKALIQLTTETKYSENAQRIAEKLNQENGVQLAADVIEHYLKTGECVYEQNGTH